MKKQTYWIVTASDDSYALSTISHSRKEAISKWLKACDMCWAKDSKKYNWHVVKINIDIVPVQPKTLQL